MTTKLKTKSNSLINLISALRTSQLFWIFSFTILTAIAAQITIPFKPVPFTLQTMLVLLAGALLGARNGAYSQVLYIALGVVGLPLFFFFSFGPAVLFGSTGGYLLASSLSAYLVVYFVQKNKSYLGVVISMFAANIFIIIVGTLFLYLFYLQNFSEAITAGAAIFTIWMVIKVFAAASIYFGISKKFQTLP